MTSGVCRRPLLKPVPQAFEADGVAVQRGHRGLRRGAEAGNSRDVLGSRPAPQFLTAAAQQRFKPQHALGQDQRADALGAADLVRRKRHQIGIHRIDIERYFPKRLDRIDMQQSARGMDDLGRLRHRLHRAGFVVGQHHRHQRRRPAREHRAQTVQIHAGPSA